MRKPRRFRPIGSSPVTRIKRDGNMIVLPEGAKLAAQAKRPFSKRAGRPLRDTVYFARGASTPKQEDQLLLAAYARQLRKDRNARLTVVGHANPGSGTHSARTLARERARKVAATLIAFGARRTQIEVRSMGSSRPAAPDNTPEGRRLNRRVRLTWPKYDLIATLHERPTAKEERVAAA